MDMPDFQSVMLPLLRLAADGEEHVMAPSIAALADGFELTAEQRAELLPGGGQRRFPNRVYWAAAHLKAAGLLASPTRGRFRITDNGKAVLKSPPAKITMAFLQQYPGYAAFKAGGGSTSAAQPVATPAAQTPDEVIAASFKALNEDLADQLLAKVLANPPDFLEKLVLTLLRAMHYGGADDDSATLLGGPGDEGVDGVVKQDTLGLDLIYVQAKRWNAGSPGGLEGHPRLHREPPDQERPSRRVHHNIVIHGGRQGRCLEGWQADRPDRWRSPHGVDDRARCRRPGAADLRAQVPRQRLLRRRVDSIHLWVRTGLHGRFGRGRCSGP
jgi:restriction system protein